MRAVKEKWHITKREEREGRKLKNDRQTADIASETMEARINVAHFASALRKELSIQNSTFF